MGQSNSCNLSCRKRPEDLNSNSYEMTSSRQTRSLEEQADEVMSKIMANSQRTINPFMSHRSSSPFREQPKTASSDPHLQLEQRIMAKQAEALLGSASPSPATEQFGSRRQHVDLFRHNELSSDWVPSSGRPLDHRLLESRRVSGLSEDPFLNRPTPSEDLPSPPQPSVGLATPHRSEGPGLPARKTESVVQAFSPSGAPQVYRPLNFEVGFSQEEDPEDQEETVINRHPQSVDQPSPKKRHPKMA